MPRTPWKDRNYRYRLIHKLIDQQMTDLPNPNPIGIMDVKHLFERSSSESVERIMNYVRSYLPVARFVYELNNSSKQSAEVLGAGHPMSEGFKIKDYELSPIDYYKRICAYRKVEALPQVIKQIDNWKSATSGIFPELEYMEWHFAQGPKYGMADLDIVLTPNRFFVEGCLTIEWDFTTNQPVGLIWVKQGRYSKFDNELVLNLGRQLFLDTYILRMRDNKFYFLDKEIDKSFLDKIRDPDRSF